jgi:hypothetical protein
MRLPQAVLALLACSCASPAPRSAPPPRDWTAIVETNYAAPADATPFELALELTELLGSRDPKLRDDYAYGITANWIARQKLFTPEELRELARRWTANLDRSVGSEGDDSVLARSFSALALSLIAARDLQTPFLRADEVQALLESALAYNARERDLRDWDPELGWIHAAAHTADLLKFLARNPHLDADHLNRILGAVELRLATPMPRAFSMGEDERLARTAAAVLVRAEHDPQGFDAFLERLVEARLRARDATPFAPENVAVEQNIAHFLRALHSGLAAVEGLPDHVARARDATLRALART